MRAEHGIERDRAFQKRVFETLRQFVMNIHADQTQELLHFFFAEAANIQAEHRQGGKILPLPGSETRRSLVQ